MPTFAALTAPHRVRAALWTLLFIVTAARMAAIFMQDVNWDEFVLLEWAVTAVRTGEIIGGSRPGLGTLALMPFAAECRNAVDALVWARVLWTVVVAAAVVAFWLLLRQVLPASPHRRAAIATGVGLWALAPPFLQTSVQVRTDQPAILFGLFGGLAFLASRAALRWAVATGLLFAVGFLFSQKLLYVGGLMGALSVGQLLIRREWRTGREVLRAAVAGAVFLAVVLSYREVMARLAYTPALLPVSGQLDYFGFYREAFGWRYYRPMLPVLVPQGIVMACLVVLTLAWVQERGRHSAEIVTAWAVTGIGFAVLLFHAGRFPYFFMVLGLFPAVVGALILAPALERLATARGRAIFLAVLWLPMAALAAAQAGALLTQHQAHQRASLEFVERNFPAEARGFEGRGAFTCRPDPDPFPARLAIIAYFAGTERLPRIQELMREFRDRPVAFMIPPVGEPYPAELWDFWRTRYVHYYSTVHVAGRTIGGGPGTSGRFEVMVPGEYVWRTTTAEAGPLEVGGHRLEPGDTVVLDQQGQYLLRLPEGGEGMLVLALPEPPDPDDTPFFLSF